MLRFIFNAKQMQSKCNTGVFKHRLKAALTNMNNSGLTVAFLTALSM